jgi:hypothetical protein
MVPSRRIAELQKAYIRLQDHSIESNRYVGSELDLAFDLTTVDTFVAGIASKVLDGESVTPEEILLLNRPFLVGNIWNGHEVHKSDISGISEMLKYANAIEEVRVILSRCFDVIAQ